MIIRCKSCFFDIWKMPQLRHVRIFYWTEGGTISVPDPPSGDEDLENLQSLYTVEKFKFSAGVLKRIPNIKILKLCYQDIPAVKEDYYQLNNICCLHKLEDLRLMCTRRYRHWVREMSFPDSLKKLTLQYTYLHWEAMKTKIGWLPHLQVLKLKQGSFIGSEWETLEDQFLNLKFLLIEKLDLECWITERAHFPCLEHLHLGHIDSLREIPSSIGDIPTLHSIKLLRCSNSVVESARKIKEEQQELGNEDLHIATFKYSWVIVPTYFP